MPNQEQFEHEGRQFQVRTELKDGEWVIRVYEDGSPATVVTYKVAIGTAADIASNPAQERLVGHLMEHARKDVTKGIVPLIKS